MLNCLAKVIGARAATNRAMSFIFAFGKLGLARMVNRLDSGAV